MNKFQERLRELRLDRKLSYSQLSACTGLGTTALCYWETGKRVPNANAIIVLAQYFDVTTDYLLGVTD